MPIPMSPIPQPPNPPRTLLGVKPVQLALVSYSDENGEAVSQFAIVGDNTVMLLDSREIGVGINRTPAGTAVSWLRDAVLKVRAADVAASTTKEA